jgi:hypothetical protein
MLAHNKSRRSPFRLSLESLETRSLLNGATPDLQMLSATALSLSSVTVQYEVLNADLAAPFPLSIYRSADQPFGPLDDLLIGQIELDAPQLTVGIHAVNVPLSQPRGINPALPYILAVADPDNLVPEMNEDNNIASFQIWVVGAVTHGYQIDGIFPPWVDGMANSLLAQGYNAAIPYDWAAPSRIPQPGIATLAGLDLASNIASTVAGLGIAPNDVVDLHLIGFSRGSVVVTTAAGLVPKADPPLAGGNLRLTLLDPHPARNDSIPYYSVSTGPIGQLSLFNFLAFQAATSDPAILIPPTVTQPESFYQNAPITAALPINPDELILMSWGNVPLQSSAAAPTSYYNLTTIMPSHEGIHAFYQQAVIPTLGTAAPLPPVVPPPIPNPPAPATGGPAFATRRQGTLYELNLATTLGTPTHVAAHIIHATQHLDRWIAAGATQRANHQLNSLIRFVTRQRGKTIPPVLADSLLRLYLSTSQILNPAPIPVNAANPR